MRGPAGACNTNHIIPPSRIWAEGGLWGRRTELTGLLVLRSSRIGRWVRLDDPMNLCSIR